MAASSDLAAQRAERIRQVLRERGVARVGDLCRELRVSAATVRRDLAALDRGGQVRRVHGGAMIAELSPEEPLFDDKAAIAADEKRKIAEAARKLIGPEDTVFLDGGSTVLALARLLAKMDRLTVVTNSLRVAAAFAGGGPRMILVGGEFRRLSQTFVGALTKPLIDVLRVDKAFMGAIGLSGEEGLTTTDPREAETKGLVMSHAQQVILMVDSRKIGKVSFVRFGSLEDVDVVITDSGVGAGALGHFRKKRVKVVVAK
jgi:DeoR/GlpR family transcriptional regulator of sugar metabolism